MLFVLPCALLGLAAAACGESGEPLVLAARLSRYSLTTDPGAMAGCAGWPETGVSKSRSAVQGRQQQHSSHEAGAGQGPGSRGCGHTRTTPGMLGQGRGCGQAGSFAPVRAPPWCMHGSWPQLAASTSAERECASIDAADRLC